MWKDCRIRYGRRKLKDAATILETKYASSAIANLSNEGSTGHFDGMSRQLLSMVE